MTDPAMALLNHVMKCAYCYPWSGKYCLYGSKLHKESNPSVDNKLVRVEKMNDKINVKTEGNKILFLGKARMIGFSVAKLRLKMTLNLF